MKSRIEEIRSIITEARCKEIKKSMEISFEEVKQMFRDSIDESANINDLLQSVANKIYQKGLNNGMAKDGEKE